MKIALLSDSHVPTILPELPSHLIDQLSGVDLILHAGDLVSLDVLKSLQDIAETIAVRGNADEPQALYQLPRKRVLPLSGYRIGLIHGSRPAEIERSYLQPGFDYDSPPMEAFFKFLRAELPGIEIIVFGHFHIPLIKRDKDRLLINPGSIAPYQGRASFAMLELGPQGPEVEILDL